MSKIWQPITVHLCSWHRWDKKFEEKPLLMNPKMPDGQTGSWSPLSGDQQKEG
jgi:hypothetical protein